MGKWMNMHVWLLMLQNPPKECEGASDKNGKIRTEVMEVLLENLPSSVLYFTEHPVIVVVAHSTGEQWSEMDNTIPDLMIKKSDSADLAITKGTVETR